MYITDDERAADAEWIDAGKAVETARIAYANDQDAREFLIRRAGLDRILTRCQAMRCEKRGARSVVAERGDCIISPEFWEQYGKPERRTVRDWNVGDFERTMQAASGSRDIVLVTGVQFSKRDLIAELPKQPIEWIAASLACDILNDANVSDAAVAICSRAFEGLVRATAQKFTWEDWIGGRGKRKHEKIDCDVPPQFWWAKGYSSLECNWDTGDFSTWIDQTYEWKAFGVQFAKADIEAMLPKHVERSGARQVEAEPVYEPTLQPATMRARSLSHDHPFAAAMAALELVNIPENERDRLTGQSIGKTMEEYYRESHKNCQVPHSDNLDDHGASVLRALKKIWDGTN